MFDNGENLLSVYNIIATAHQDLTLCSSINS